MNFPLQWRHNDHNGVSNHQPHCCLLSFIQAQIKENIKAPRHWPLCGEFTGTGEFPAQSASNQVTRKMFPFDDVIMHACSRYVDCYLVAVVSEVWDMAPNGRHRPFMIGWSKYHWGSSHEGSGRHPRQHGGGRGRRFSKFMANSHCFCSLLRLSFCELIVNVMGHIDAEFRAAVIRHLVAIPAWTFTRRRGCRSCLFSRGRGCRSALTRVPLCADERRASLIHTTAAKLGTVYIFLNTKSY